MEAAELKELTRTSRPYFKANNLKALAVLLFISLFTTFGVYLSLNNSGLIWFSGQLILAITTLQWFVLIHDLGHGSFFTSSLANSMTGHFASLFPILPFYPWRYIHRGHHLWTGWKDHDPTMTVIIPQDLSYLRRKFIDLCWKFWIPIFSLAFSFSNFWNIKKLFSMYPEANKKAKNLFSIIFLILSWSSVIFFLGFDLFLKIWPTSYLLFLIISDPLLISQHSGIPQNHSQGKKVAPIPLKDQYQYTRSLIFPAWINRFILMGFNNHIIHHIFPTIPGYNLWKIRKNFSQEERWLTWLKQAKSIPAHDLLFNKKRNLKEVL